MRKQFTITLLALLLTTFIFIPAQANNTTKEKFVKSALTNTQMDTAADLFLAGANMEIIETDSTESSTCVSEPITTLHLVTDKYGLETMWRVMSGNIIVAFGAVYASETAYTIDMELPAGEYTFTIYDIYGDGICCNGGDGSFSLVNGETTIFSGGSFNFYATVDFCVEEPAPIILGCMTAGTHNYNPEATEEDGSCETCSDGIMNGDETDVDCGGTNCEACQEPVVLGCMTAGTHNYNPEATEEDDSCETCSDGIMNGDETDVDCGGTNCEPCVDIVIEDEPSEDNACPSDSITTLTLRTDHRGRETRWCLKSGGLTISHGRNYGNNTIYTIDFDLPPGDYKFIIVDAARNGINGEGYYSLDNGDTNIAFGNSFGRRDVTEFCIGGDHLGRFAGERAELSTSMQGEKVSSYEDAFEVFPNPAHDRINLDLSKLKSIHSVIVYTIMGQRMKQIDPVNLNRPIDISSLARGIYIVAIETDKGVLNKKFFKE